MKIKNKVSKRAAAQQKLGFQWLIIIAIIFVESFTYTWQRTQSTQITAQISEAQTTLTKTISYHNALSVERERLKSDNRIIHVAKTRLNLSTDTLKQTIYLAQRF